MKNDDLIYSIIEKDIGKVNRKYWKRHCWVCVSVAFLDDPDDSAWKSVILESWTQVKKITQDENISLSKALELICGDFLAGQNINYEEEK